MASNPQIRSCPRNARGAGAVARAVSKPGGGLPLDIGLISVFGPRLPTQRPDSTHRLTDILRALPQGELDALVHRLGIRIDPAKRIDPPSQVARALVSLPELRDPTRLGPASVELIHRGSEAGGALRVPSLPPSLEPLFARGLLFARAAGHGVELILPSAYLVQLRT